MRRNRLECQPSCHHEMLSTCTVCISGSRYVCTYSTCGTCTPVLYFRCLYACTVLSVFVQYLYIRMYSAYCTHTYVCIVRMLLVRLYSYISTVLTVLVCLYCTYGTYVRVYYTICYRPQSKPVIELQTETDTKGKRLLTCVYFPQKESEMFRKPSAGSGPSKLPPLLCLLLYLLLLLSLVIFEVHIHFMHNI